MFKTNNFFSFITVIELSLNLSWNWNVFYINAYNEFPTRSGIYRWLLIGNYPISLQLHIK